MHSGRWLRIFAAVLAAAIGLIQLAFFADAERRLGTTGIPDGPETAPAAPRWISAVGWSLTWVAGSALLFLRDHRRGVAVVVTVAAVSTASAVVGPTTFAAGGWSDASTWPELVGVVAGPLAAVLAGVAAFLARPRGQWRRGAPGPFGAYVTVAVLAWLPVAFDTTAFAPPGAPRRFVEPSYAPNGVLELGAVAFPLLVVALVLWIAPRLRPEAAGAVILAYAVPNLLSQAPALVRVVQTPGVIVTPTGVLGVIGLLGVGVAGAVWVTRRPPDGPPVVGDA
jgi:hypothetical protein